MLDAVTQAKIYDDNAIHYGHPKWLKERIGPGEVKALNQPHPDSHKGENGQLLIVAGDQRHHGAVKLAAAAAGKIVDLVFVSSTELNNQLIKKMKSELAEFIPLEREEIKENIKRMDAALLGPGLGVNEDIKTLVNDMVSRYKKTTFVLDADALAVLRPELLGGNCIVTPHREEFKKLFGCRPTQKNLVRMSRKYNGCVIVLKGDPDYVVAGEEVKKNVSGNAGMTKGGTGDVLAGLVAALATQNDPFLAARAGVFLNGEAADGLAERVSYYYNAGDLVKEIPKILKRFQG